MKEELIVFLVRKVFKEGVDSNSSSMKYWSLSLILLPAEIDTAKEFSVIMFQHGDIRKKLSSYIIKYFWEIERRYRKNWITRIEGEVVYWLDYIKENREMIHSMEDLRKFIISLYNRSIPKEDLGTFSIQVSPGYVVKI